MRVPPLVLAQARLIPLIPLVLPLAAALLTTGCGRKSSAKDDHKIVPLTVTSREPVHYALEDQACQGAAGDTPLTKATISAWDQQSVVAEAATLHDTRSTASLTSQAIKNTTYGDDYERECDAAKPANHWCDGSDGQQKSWLLTAKELPVRICQDGHTYGRLSVEGVALTSAYYLQQAHDRYRQLAPTAADPAPIQLSVFPQFIDYYENFATSGQPERLKTWITHNLAYFPEGHMIAVFPEDAAKARTMPGFFWESEFVLSHEYGHHIDFTRHGKDLRSAGLTWNPLTNGFVDERALGQGQSANSNRAQMAGALAEGFADLMAYYSEGGTSRSLIGIPELGYNRNIANDTFNNGDAKILTEEHLAALFGEIMEPPVLEGRPVYGDIHVIGAIIAHTADVVFSQLTATHPELGHEGDVNQRYLLTLTYMDQIVSGMAVLNLDASDQDVLAPVGQALEKTADAYLSSFPLAGGDDAAAAVKANLCRTMQRQLPALVPTPFARGAGC